MKIGRRKPAKRGLLEKQIKLAKELSRSELKKKIDNKTIYDYLDIKSIRTKGAGGRGSAARRRFCYVLYGLGESMKGTRLGDALEMMARNESYKARDINGSIYSKICSMLRSAEIIEKYKKSHGEQRLSIEVIDQKRLLASAKLGRIIQKDEWDAVQNKIKKNKTKN